MQSARAMSISKKIGGLAFIRNPCILCVNSRISASFSTAREIAEDSHVKVLKYVFRKELKAQMLRSEIEEKVRDLQELRKIVLEERSFTIEDTPGLKEIKLKRIFNDELITVTFNAWYEDDDTQDTDQSFDVQISKTENSVNEIPYFFKFKYTTKPWVGQIDGKYYSLKPDETGKMYVIIFLIYVYL